MKQRVSGQFTGTTDEIIQWASCKWGYPTDVARAQAVEESMWKQSMIGDNGESFGLLQVKDSAWDNTHPWSEFSTAYNVDWAMGVWRACFEGLMYYGPQSKGDLWGCTGAWYSGEWLDEGAQSYVDRVKANMDSKPYLKWISSAGGTPPTEERVRVPTR